MNELSELDVSRRKASFDSSRLAAMLEPESRQRTKADILQLMMNEPAFDKSKRPYLSRSQALAAGIAATRRLIQLKREHRWTQEQLNIAMELLGDTTSLTLHELAFRPVIASQGSDEQQAYWLPRATEYAILGCYAQTELGHGSNVQKLETTSTYDPATQQFDLHSPTLTSTKWWMGGLGVLASHCIVQAQLIAPHGGKMKHYGPHLFIIRIRDEQTHEPLPGITIGDIGPKAHGAMAGLDNGYIRFAHVRIPHNSMLSRFAQISPAGVYTMPPHAKLSYGGMIYIRAQMIEALARALSRSVTIAARYLHVRRQFGDRPTEKETQVIRYPSVYMRIVPTLVNAYVFALVGKQMLLDYNAMAAKLKQGDTAMLAQVHAMSSGLKVYVSTAVVEGCETNRRACGGHGFLASAGLAAIYALQLPSTTYEGDNFILNQQVCRAAVKMRDVHRSDTHAKGSSGHVGSLEQACAILKSRAEVMVDKLAEKKARTQQWTDLSWECVSVGNAITEANISQHLRRAVDDLRRGRHMSPEQQVLVNMYELWHFYALENARGDLLEHKLVLPEHIQSLRSAIDEKTRAILPDIIGLTDAFGFSDWELGSTLGCTAGRPYEELLRHAEENRDLNLGDQSYQSDIMAMLREGRSGFAERHTKL